MAERIADDSVLTKDAACAILNLPRDTTHKVAKFAFYKLSLQHHPDKAGSSRRAHEHYVRIKEAWEYLDPRLSSSNDGQPSASSSVIKQDLYQVLGALTEIMHNWESSDAEKRTMSDDEFLEMVMRFNEILEELNFLGRTDENIPADGQALDMK